jgi:hypothetical protein
LFYGGKVRAQQPNGDILVGLKRRSDAPTIVKESLMASSTNETAAEDIKSALEAYAGHEIDASVQQIEQQIRFLNVPFSTYSFTPAGSVGATGDNIGQVVSKSVIVVIPPACSTSELLDVSGVTVVSSAGNVTLLITNFLCPNENGRYYSEPVNIVATAASASPIFLTVTHSLVITPPNTSATNVQINIFAWDANGAPAPNVTVNWRCRVPTQAIIQ